MELVLSRPEWRDQWWAKEKDRLLAGVTNRERIPDRPPDHITEEKPIVPSSTSSHIERRWSLFSTWPVEVTVSRYEHNLRLGWDTPEGLLAVRVWDHDEIMKSERDTA